MLNNDLVLEWDVVLPGVGTLQNDSNVQVIAEILTVVRDRHGCNFVHRINLQIVSGLDRENFPEEALKSVLECDPCVRCVCGKIPVRAGRPKLFAILITPRDALAHVLVTGVLVLDVLVEDARYRPFCVETDPCNGGVCCAPKVEMCVVAPF